MKKIYTYFFTILYVLLGSYTGVIGCAEAGKKDDKTVDQQNKSGKQSSGAETDNTKQTEQGKIVFTLKNFGNPELYGNCQLPQGSFNVRASESTYSHSMGMAGALLSLLAYQDYETVIKPFLQSNDFSQSAFVESGKRELKAFIAQKTDVTVISFMGTNSFDNIIRDLEFSTIEAKEAGLEGFDGKLHEGFARSIKDLLPKIEKQLVSLKYEKQPIYIFGHSLGGAISVLLAHHFVKNPQMYNLAGIYTFGQPITGNRQYASQNAALLGSKYHRIINDNDIVPHLPITSTIAEKFSKKLFDDKYETYKNASSLIESLITSFGYTHIREPLQINSSLKKIQTDINFIAQEIAFWSELKKPSLSDLISIGTSFTLKKNSSHFLQTVTTGNETFWTPRFNSHGSDKYLCNIAASSYFTNF